MSERDQYIADCRYQIKQLYQELFDLVGDHSEYTRRIKRAVEDEIMALVTEIEIAAAGATSISQN